MKNEVEVDVCVISHIHIHIVFIFIELWFKGLFVQLMQRYYTFEKAIRTRPSPQPRSYTTWERPGLISLVCSEVELSLMLLAKECSSCSVATTFSSSSCDDDG